MFKPLNGRILVRPDEVEKVTASGIIVATDDKKEKATTGVVEQGNSVVSSGVRIAFSAYGYDEIAVDGETFFVVPEASIIGIF